VATTDIAALAAQLGIDEWRGEFLRALTAQAPVGIFVSDPAGSCVFANDRLCELLGLSREAALGYGWVSALHADEADAVLRDWENARLAEAELFAHESRFVRPDGSLSWVQTTASPLRNPAGGCMGWVGVCVDVTARRASEQRFQELVERAHDVVYTIDRGGRITSVNAAAVALTGYERDELMSMRLFDLIAPEDRHRVQEAVDASRAGSDTETELQLVTRDGRRRFVAVRGRFVEPDGPPGHFEGIARDTTERHLLEEELARQAFHDELTGLPNRALFFDRLEQALARRARDGGDVAVMLLDVDEFKLVNDTLGHAAGDQLLLQIARRLRETTRAGETVARVGGDEFALVAEGLSAEQVVTLAKRIRSAFEDPYEVEGTRLRIDASIGIAVSQHNEQPDALLRDADAAMYRAKTANTGSFEFFDEAMRSRLVRELALAGALREALERGALEVHYQPIVLLPDRRLLAAEALVRWRHPEWGWLRPEEFIPIAEKSGLIVPLGRLVLAEAARQAARWRELDPEAVPLGVFVNVSAIELGERSFGESVLETLRGHGLGGEGIALELTERAFLETSDSHVAENLLLLSDAGVRLVLDDFGTGYSALASLRRYPFSALKIDRQLIQALPPAGEGATMLRAVVGLGQALGLTTIAEGVEDETQLGALCRLGCDAAQGYLLARPQTGARLTELLASGETPSPAWSADPEARAAMAPDALVAGAAGGESRTARARGLVGPPNATSSEGDPRQ
jgi:diguanylate cyclase (GGDEF)-like protein/PAS domain S-box-containing protein